jgi:hypothetical protein
MDLDALGITDERQQEFAEHLFCVFAAKVGLERRPSDIDSMVYFLSEMKRFIDTWCPCKKN